MFRSYVIVTASVLVVFSAFFGPVFAQSTVFVPIWLEEGAYVEFSCGEGLWYPSSASSGIVYESATFKWTCVDLTGTVAKLNITLTYNIEGEDPPVFSAEVLVDAVNRSVYSLDGTLLGATQLWSESNPSDGDQVVLWNIAPDKVVGTVETNRVGETPQGKQGAYKVTGNETINGNLAVFNLRYDQNTGIMIRGLMWNEGVFKALSKGILNSVTISDTNIDLGPSTETFDINSFIPIIIIAVAFVLIFVTIYWKKSKKRKPKYKN